MADEPQNQFQSPKSPQEELDELLRQSMPTRPASGIKLPDTALRRSVNWSAALIWGLGILLIVGTGYLLLNGLTFNTGEVVLELDQDQATLAIDTKTYGLVSTGDTLRLKAGQHTLSLTKDSFLELAERVEVTRGQALTVVLKLLPIPVMTPVLDYAPEFIRLNQDGSEMAYFDARDRTFKTVNLTDNQTTALFRGSFSGVTDVIWSGVAQSAMVKLNGRPGLPNMLDNRAVRGRYVPLGERPTQGAAKFTGATTWLFDDDRKTAAGWQPILLSDNVRQVAFSPRGDEIVYIYETADGEYSLSRAWPDGLEWERLIVEMPRLQDPEFIWGPDDRWLLIRDAGKLLVLDLSAKTLSEPLTDYLAGSPVAISTDGAKVAYLAGAGDGVRLMDYDLLTGTVAVVEDVAVDATSRMAWTGVSTFIVTTTDVVFKLVDIERGMRTTIPFVGADAAAKIQRLEYSVAGKVLMLVTGSGVLMMRV